jgi:hypothetical protein
LQKSVGGYWLGQQISKLISAGNEANNESFVGYHIANKMEINLHMFCASMKDWVGGEVSGSNVVTP